MWNLTTVLGAVGVQALGDPAALGLDAAAPAAFLGLVWPYLRVRRTAVVAALAAVVALVAVVRRPRGRAGAGGRRGGPARVWTGGGGRELARGVALRHRAVRAEGGRGVRARGGGCPATRVRSVLALLPPAMLGALVLTQVAGSADGLVVDLRLAGLAVAAVALALRAPFLLVLVLAVATTALLRLVF